MALAVGHRVAVAFRLWSVVLWSPRGLGLFMGNFCCIRRLSLRMATGFDWRWVQCGPCVIPGDWSCCVCFWISTVQSARCVVVVDLQYFEWVQRGSGLAFVFIFSCSSG